VKKHRAAWGPLDYATVVLPCIEWIRTYDLKQYLLVRDGTVLPPASAIPLSCMRAKSSLLSCLQFDLLAGVAVAFTVVPQGMSYANIALVPSVWGLYGAFTPLLVCE